MTIMFSTITKHAIYNSIKLTRLRWWKRLKIKTSTRNFTFTWNPFDKLQEIPRSLKIY